MKIPDKIKVAGHEYKIKWDTKRLAREGFVGEADHNKDIIYLSKEFPLGEARAKSEIEETLLHEILHTIDTNYNNKSLDEKEITRLAIGLYQVLKDNFNF